MPVCSLLDLPPDVVIQVFYYSTSFARIALRQTCTMLSSLSRERILWMYCLNHLIETAHLYPPSFPMDEMTTEQLEAAANAPLRFRCDFANDRKHLALKKWHAIDSERSRQRLRYLVLVPGGRYLVTLNDETLRLWDMGAVACEYVPDRVLAKVECEIGLKRGLRMDVEFNGDELYIQLGASSNLGVWCTLYKINPLEQSPRLTLIGVLDTKLFTPVSSRFDPYGMVVLYSTSSKTGGNMWLWDLSTKSLATWSSGGKTAISIYTMEGCALLISRAAPDQVPVQGDIFALPKFSQLSSSQQPQQLPTSLIHSVNWAEDFSGWTAEESLVVSPSRLKPRETDFPFDLIGWRQDLHKSLSDPSQLEVVTSHQGLYTGNMVIPVIGDFTAVYLPDEVRIMYWIRRPQGEKGGVTKFQHLYVHITSLAEEHQGGSSSVDMCAPLWTQWTWQDMAWGLFGFCAATGRLCIVDEEDMRVIDYSTAMPDSGSVAKIQAS
ncbi:hypothetical protein DL96DRAFT_728791 [Flagelloscypha sp. PMI_526]|nr:hypothetical protein DL96DRAFT_728791 [Flagelloscypha sp. PMI_526]